MLKSKNAKCPKKFDQSRLDLVCVNLFPELSRKKIKKIIDNGGAYLNKKRVTLAKLIVHAGDLVEIFFAEENSKSENSKASEKPKKSKYSLEKNVLLFSHKDFIVVNKPAGISVQGTLDSDENTIVHLLHKMDPHNLPLENLFLVHRLDKETSGLLIIAKNREAQKVFEELFKIKKIIKKYAALCFYKPKKDSGIISFPIARDRSKKNVYFAVTGMKQWPDQKTAVTKYEVVKYFPKSLVSLISCLPETGRTHQIRVHLSSIGVPILGDKTYANNISSHSYARCVPRHMLHAQKIEFTYCNNNFIFEAPFAQDFEELLSSLEKF